MLEYLFYGVCDFTANTITGDESDLIELDQSCAHPKDRHDEARTVYTPPYLVGSWKNRFNK